MAAHLCTRRQTLQQLCERAGLMSARQLVSFVCIICPKACAASSTHQTLPPTSHTRLTVSARNCTSWFVYFKYSTCPLQPGRHAAQVCGSASFSFSTCRWVCVLPSTWCCKFQKPRTRKIRTPATCNPTAQQFEQAFLPKRLCNWQQPELSSGTQVRSRPRRGDLNSCHVCVWCENRFRHAALVWCLCLQAAAPRATGGRTTFIADSTGHLRPGMRKPGSSFRIQLGPADSAPTRWPKVCVVYVCVCVLFACVLSVWTSVCTTPDFTLQSRHMCVCACSAPARPPTVCSPR